MKWENEIEESRSWDANKLRTFLENQDGIYRQCAFWDTEAHKWHGGILINPQTIICACCGGSVEVEEIIELAVSEGFDKYPIVVFPEWIDVSEEIYGSVAEVEEAESEFAEELN